MLFRLFQHIHVFFFGFVGGGEICEYKFLKCEAEGRSSYLVLGDWLLVMEWFGKAWSSAIAKYLDTSMLR